MKKEMKTHFSEQDHSGPYRSSVQARGALLAAPAEPGPAEVLPQFLELDRGEACPWEVLQLLLELDQGEACLL